ncbi:uncharacterized protein K452DRAFT_255887 [Aplosporella prunicola CBS 121167]|uniref:Zn(2)-C6 fungal-type domain-containing protein n=1 Tax=Aplosporella prunicola CBS 121167 TaxID=1176127 RepID=A0A6A6B470_9PEZI|nr:uncharacterized protein K452DRAFT_255887 [Aplosporella prunicola CBS 121167]KAF2138418.1 hypothetical protein K452DRAFT_255887 [Aplosporella prunicola CBS 121167]
MDSCRDPNTKKRCSNACDRCRRQKIKCSGRKPCEGCIRRKTNCVWDTEEPKRVVTKKYLTELKNRISQLEATVERNVPLPRATDPVSPEDTATPASEPSQHTDLATAPGEQSPQYEDESEDIRMTNPLSAGPSTHIIDQEGRALFLGHSSNWSFIQRVLRLTYKRLHRNHFPSEMLHGDGRTYDLGLDDMQTTVIPDATSLPSLDFSIYLINTVKFRTGQIFHLFDEATFMPQLYEFYENPQQKMNTMRFWYIHFLVLLAFGKAFVVSNNRTKRPPGSDWFVRATALLPGVMQLVRDPVVSTEILCCMALYHQALDSRWAAHNLIGQAMRLAFLEGMHTDIRPGPLEESHIQRCRKIWWTVFILDRQMSALMGVPMSVHDNDITAPLPAFPDSRQKTAAIEIHVKLSQTLAQVVNIVYGIDGRWEQTFISSTQDVLRRVANVADELAANFEVPPPNQGKGIPRVSGHLNLLYHQCILLATRPFLLSFFDKRLETLDGENTSSVLADPVRILLQVCYESARKIVTVLRALQEQSLIESFIPFDLESALSAGMAIAMTNTVSPAISSDAEDLLHTVYDVLDEMGFKGNLVASVRLSELRHLEFMLGEAKAALERTSAAMAEIDAATTGNTSVYVPMTPLGNTGELMRMMEGSGDLDTLMSSQLLNVAEFLNIYSVSGHPSMDAGDLL